MKEIFTIIIIFVFSIITSAQWVQTNGSYGGNVQCMAAGETNIFIGTKGGVYFSSDNGTNWTQKNNGINNNDIRCLAFSGRNILAGTYGGGIYISTNNGIISRS